MNVMGILTLLIGLGLAIASLFTSGATLPFALPFIVYGAKELGLPIE